MMNITTAFVLAAALAPWQDPSVNSRNRLPARELIVPCETEELAIAIARGEKKKTESKWVKCPSVKPSTWKAITRNLSSNNLMRGRYIS